MSESKRRWKPKVTRRGFLIGLGATAGTLAVGVAVGLPYARRQIATMLDDSSGPPSNLVATPNAWFEIAADNTVTLYVPKVEMGQGIHTALGQIAAEELEIDWEQLIIKQAPTGIGLDDGAGTGGSGSVATMYQPLREAGAHMREVLRAEASNRLSVATTDLVAEKGRFYAKNNPEQGITYGELVAEGVEWVFPEEAPELKSREQFHTIGQAKPRNDFPDKLTGRAVYGYDMRLPNMLYGAVARPSTVEGKLVSANKGSAESADGVVGVVAEDDFAGVAATSRNLAYLGLRQMELEWDDGPAWSQAEIEAMTTVGEGNDIVIQKEGDVDLSGEGVIEAEYRSPMAAHAHLEPQAALADVREDGVDVYSSTQFPASLRDAVAELLGRDPSEVTAHATYLGGGFGRKLGGNAGGVSDAAIEATRLSQATGRPVHVGWNRIEEMRNGYLRPPTHSVLRGKVGSDGKILSITHDQASGDVAFPFFPGFLVAVMGADFGAWRGSMIQYDAPKLTTAWRIELPVKTGWWRGLGLMANTFAVESFIDELAHSVNMDPLAFRLLNMPDTERGNRFKVALQAAADAAGWSEPVPEGRGRGIACSVDVNTVVANVAEVSVVDGQIKVEKMVSSVDPGLIINPDGVKAQTQGSIVMGLSSTFFEEITIEDGKITATNFDRYPLLTIKETPDIEVVLLESGDSPYGIGEPPMGPVAASVANAVFNLTGQRLRTLPLKLT